MDGSDISHTSIVWWTFVFKPRVSNCSICICVILDGDPMTKILGLSGYYHDSAACLIIDGSIIAACQEERFSRIKHDSSFPSSAIDAVLSIGKISLDEIDAVVFYDKPFLTFERLTETFLYEVPFGFGGFSKIMPLWMKDKLFLKSKLLKCLAKFDSEFPAEKLFFSEHHFSHAASAFYPSPFTDALVLTLDGVGEWACGSIAIGSGNKLEIIKEMRFPHSLGLLYSAFTYYTGFKVNSGEYKVMGLAPYGTPIYSDIILDNLINLNEDGSFSLNLEYFNFTRGLTMVNDKFATLFGEPIRTDENFPVTQFHMDIAASVQHVVETVLVKMATYLRHEYELPNLCLAGGVALNCVANGVLSKLQLFDNIWVQPAAGDAGGSIGAGLGYLHSELNMPRTINKEDSMQGSLLGTSYSDKSIEDCLKEFGVTYTKLYQNSKYQTVSAIIKDGNVVGWFQDRMEFGPRALGARSILADPRRSDMQKKLNLKIKFRESFRPFAPCILEDEEKNYFESVNANPYMLFVSRLKRKYHIDVKPDENKKVGFDKLSVVRSAFPAITHVDYSARVQIVKKKTNPSLHKLLAEFFKKTNCPMLVNTSFNVRGQPIVESPKDALECFLGTEMDYLVLGNFLIAKNDQPEHLAATPHLAFEPD